MSMTLDGTDLAPSSHPFAYTRLTWEQQWENSRLARVNESMERTRRLVMDLILDGDGDQAATMWGALVPVWTMMLAHPSAQAAALRTRE